VALPAFARRTPLLQQSIDISCLPGPQQQTCSSRIVAVGPCWDRLTDRQTDSPVQACPSREFSISILPVLQCFCDVTYLAGPGPPAAQSTKAGTAGNMFGFCFLFI